jgi:hypothetical protein
MHTLTKAEVMRFALEKRAASVGTALKDAVAPLRKSLIAFALK